MAGAALLATLLAGWFPALADSRKQTPANPSHAAPKLPLVWVQGVRCWCQADRARVVVDLEAAVEYTVSRLSNPDRVYLDLYDTRVRPDIESSQTPSEHTFLNRIRIAENTSSVTRFVFDLNKAARHAVYTLTSPSQLVVELTSVPASGSTPEAPPQQILDSSAPPKPAGKTKSPLALPPKPGEPLVSLSTLRVPRVTRPPKLKDFLTGEPRQAEAVVTDFRQREPGDGVPISQKTTAYLSYDNKNLYVVFVCEDKSGGVRAHMAKREEISDDDVVGVYLDTFHDRRHAYAFETNPLGLQRDGLITEGQKSTDYTFDTLWNSEGRVTEQGYIVWMAIPFKSLRFSNDAEQRWGIALGRTILRNNENAYWPAITERIEGFVNQMAALDGLDEISPGRNMQFIPYGMFTTSHFLDTRAPSFRTQNEVHGGLDSKFILKDALTLDVTVNPDFSQVESDEPQATINQRFEVFFPEKRPFFMDNSGYYQTPVNLFYSRRVIDPQLGVRLTGKINHWAVGALFMDDRAEGSLLPATDPSHGDRAGIGVLRIQHDLGSQSSVGVLVTSRDFGPSSNRIFAFDTRLKLSPNWVFTGQVMNSETHKLDGTQLSGPGYLAQLDYSGRNFTYSTNYTDLSPSFRSEMGFVRRVDLRQGSQYVSYLWHTEGRHLLSFGPTVSVSADWDHQGQLQDWSVTPAFVANFAGQTSLRVGHSQGYEFFSGIGFRESSTYTSFYTSFVKWMGISASYGRGTAINYFPAAGLSPFLADSGSASFTLTLRPIERMRIDSLYIYNRLGTRTGTLPPGVPSSSSIFNNHIARFKLNYQFTRALSVRAIADYYALLPNTLLIGSTPSKVLTGDILLTYLVHPGTALYIGYTNRHENLALDPTIPPSVQINNSLSMTTGRQFFIKLSYLFRF
jgi:hypothetical protein